jgi:hypothetical protein
MDSEEMGELATDFFQKLYIQEESINPRIIFDCMQERVDADTNQKLVAPFTDKEISDVLFQIAPIKGPGPNGFPMRFQTNWDLLKEEVVHDD